MHAVTLVPLMPHTDVFTGLLCGALTSVIGASTRAAAAERDLTSSRRH